MVSPELQKLYDALAVSPATMKALPDRDPVSIAWTKIHNVPDFVYFDHRGHVAAGVTCQQCHGPVETMEKMRQVEDLTMGWCVNCHREANRVGVAGKTVQASIGCATCHY